METPPTLWVHQLTSLHEFGRTDRVPSLGLPPSLFCIQPMLMAWEDPETNTLNN